MQNCNQKSTKDKIKADLINKISLSSSQNLSSTSEHIITELGQ